MKLKMTQVKLTTHELDLTYEAQALVELMDEEGAGKKVGAPHQ